MSQKPGSAIFYLRGDFKLNREVSEKDIKTSYEKSASCGPDEVVYNIKIILKKRHVNGDPEFHNNLSHPGHNVNINMKKSDDKGCDC